MNQTNNRRGFVKKAAIGGLAALSIPGIITSAFAAEKSKKTVLAQDDVLQGRELQVADGTEIELVSYGTENDQTTTIGLRRGNSAARRHAII